MPRHSTRPERRPPCLWPPATLPANAPPPPDPLHPSPVHPRTRASPPLPTPASVEELALAAPPSGPVWVVAVAIRGEAEAVGGASPMAGVAVAAAIAVAERPPCPTEGVASAAASAADAMGGPLAGSPPEPSELASAALSRRPVDTAGRVGVT